MTVSNVTNQYQVSFHMDRIGSDRICHPRKYLSLSHTHTHTHTHTHKLSLVFSFSYPLILFSIHFTLVLIQATARLTKRSVTTTSSGSIYIGITAGKDSTHTQVHPTRLVVEPQRALTVTSLGHREGCATLNTPRHFTNWSFPYW